MSNMSNISNMSGANPQIQDLIAINTSSGKELSAESLKRAKEIAKDLLHPNASAENIDALSKANTEEEANRLISEVSAAQAQADVADSSGVPAAE